MDPKQIENFIEQVKLRAFDDAYIDAKEEKEIYEAAIKDGVKIEQAQALLKQACARYQFGLESDMKSMLEIVLEQFCENDGKIDVEEYNDAIAIGTKLLKRSAPRATLIQRDVEEIAINIIKRQGYKIQRGLAKHVSKNFPHLA